MSTEANEGASARAKESFLTRVAELLHQYGTPAHRQERLLFRLSETLDVRAQYLVTPTSLLLAFGEGPAQRTHLARVEPGDVNLGKLVEFDELLEALEDGELSIELAREQLEEIAAQGPRYRPATTALASGVASAGAAVLFGGGELDVLATFGLGIGVDLLGRLLVRMNDGARMLELAAGVLTAFATAVLAPLVPLSPGIVTLASLIVVVPGLSLTVAMIELATRHLVAGTARFFGALTTFLTIASASRSGGPPAPRWPRRSPG